MSLKTKLDWTQYNHLIHPYSTPETLLPKPQVYISPKIFTHTLSEFHLSHTYIVWNIDWKFLPLCLSSDHITYLHIFLYELGASSHVSITLYKRKTWYITLAWGAQNKSLVLNNSKNCNLKSSEINSFISPIIIVKMTDYLILKMLRYLCISICCFM